MPISDGHSITIRLDNNSIWIQAVCPYPKEWSADRKCALWLNEDHQGTEEEPGPDGCFVVQMLNEADPAEELHGREDVVVATVPIIWSGGVDDFEFLVKREGE